MRNWFTRFFITDPAGRTHAADDRDTAREIMERMEREFDGAEIEIYAQIITVEKSQTLQTCASNGRAASVA
jgi:hypothetical protein